jgi:hypothetical protein
MYRRIVNVLKIVFLYMDKCMCANVYTYTYICIFFAKKYSSSELDKFYSIFSRYTAYLKASSHESRCLSFDHQRPSQAPQRLRVRITATHIRNLTTKHHRLRHNPSRFQAIMPDAVIVLFNHLVCLSVHVCAYINTYYTYIIYTYIHTATQIHMLTPVQSYSHTSTITTITII